MAEFCDEEEALEDVDDLTVEFVELVVLDCRWLVGRGDMVRWMSEC